MERLLYLEGPHGFNPPFSLILLSLWGTGVRMLSSAEELHFRGTWFYFFVSISAHNPYLLCNRTSRNVCEWVCDQWLFQRCSWRVRWLWAVAPNSHLFSACVWTAGHRAVADGWSTGFLWLVFQTLKTILLPRRFWLRNSLCSLRKSFHQRR